MSAHARRGDPPAGRPFWASAQALIVDHSSGAITARVDHYQVARYVAGRLAEGRAFPFVLPRLERLNCNKRVTGRSRPGSQVCIDINLARQRNGTTTATRS